MKRTKRSRKPQDICAIIETCAKSKVRFFKYGALEFSFADSLKTTNRRHGHSAQSMEEVEQEAITQSEVTLNEGNLSLLQVEDPEKFEEFVTSNDALDLDVGESGGEA